MVRIEIARREIDYRGGACLPHRRPFAPCRECQDACPIGALAIETDGFQIGETCEACGRCAAACPTGALTIADVEPSARWCAAGPVELECARVPAGRCADPETRVPCLGALGVEAILAWVLAAKGQSVILVDRGWCASCPVGSGASPHPAQPALDQATALMAAMGLKELLAPRLVRRPFDPKIRDDRSGRGVPSRRDLLRRLGPADENPESDGLLAKRRRVTGRLGSLAQRYGVDLPSRHFPSLALDEACQAHGVCAAVCPTGALRLDALANGRRLSFDADDCLACGRCAAQCPEKALSIAERGNGRRPEGRTELGRRAVAVCSDCGDDFVAIRHPSICPACQRRTQLGRLGLALVRTARTAEPTTTHDPLI